MNRGLQIAHSRITVSNRYVFFLSLADREFPVYNRLLKIGQNYTKQIQTQLQSQSTNLEGLDKIKKYIDLIGQLAKKEQENEITFIKNFQSILLKDKTGELADTFKNYINNLDTNFNYPELIGLINDLMRKKDSIEEERRKRVLNDMQLITKNFESLPETIQQEYRELSEQKYSAFTSKARTKLLQPMKNEITGETISYQTSINSLISQKINATLSALTKSKKLSKIVHQAWLIEKNWTEEYIASELLAVVVKEVSSLSLNELTELQGKDLAQYIETNFLSLRTNLTKEYIENVSNLMVQRARRTLEEVALTSRRGLADMFLALTREEQENVISDYKKYGFDIDLKQINMSPLTKEKEKISKKLGEAIRRAANDQINENFQRAKGESYDAFKKRILAIKKKNESFFKKRTLENNLKNCISVKLTGSSWAEFQVSEDFRQQLAKNIFIPGKTIQLKTDASATITLNNDIEFELPKTQEEISSIIDSFGRNFLTRYNEKSSGEINIEKAVESYKDAMQLILDQVNKLIEKENLTLEEQQKILSLLNNFLNTSISVKDYTYGNNELGFHGGSLGAGGERILRNIEKMYELGGISTLDKQLLYFALINCSEASIGYTLKDSLATYLLGAAAMIMFDDGFATSEHFLSQIINNFGFAPKGLHLYLLQSKYIPASYIYSEIYQNLLPVYNDLLNNCANFIKGQTNYNNRVVITNNISDNDIPTDYSKESKYNKPQERWNYIAQEAEKRVNVEFIFMAGLLDIFQQIPKAFDI